MIRLTSKARSLLAQQAARESRAEVLPSRFPRACIVYCPRNTGIAWMVRQGRVNVAEYKGPEAKQLASAHRDKILAKLKK
jgi:hypothetical protein